jgi:hypothetical protein
MIPAIGVTILTMFAGGDGTGATDPKTTDVPAATGTPAPAEADDAWTVRRVGGDMDAVVERQGTDYVCGEVKIDTPLPEGYPMPTPPGAIELKRYPAVRRAEISGEGSGDRGQDRGFWPLFQHIKKREIAMTSPVEMELRGWESDEEPTAWTMAFLYRTADLGPTGDDGNIVVRDAEPITVIAMGLQGKYRQGRFDIALEQLEEWLAAHPEWERAGDARWLGYNGPSWFRPLWAEVQIPVRARAVAPEAQDAPDGDAGT